MLIVAAITAIPLILLMPLPITTKSDPTATCCRTTATTITAAMLIRMRRTRSWATTPTPIASPIQWLGIATACHKAPIHRTWTQWISAPLTADPAHPLPPSPRPPPRPHAPLPPPPLTALGVLHARAPPVFLFSPHHLAHPPSPSTHSSLHAPPTHPSHLLPPHPPTAPLATTLQTHLTTRTRNSHVATAPITKMEALSNGQNSLKCNNSTKLLDFRPQTNNA